MRINKNFLTQELNGEYYMISTSNTKFNGIVKGNETVASIIECLKTESTVDDITTRILEEYNIDDRKKVEDDVIKVINDLKKIGAIDG